MNAEKTWIDSFLKYTCVTFFFSCHFCVKFTETLASCSSKVMCLQGCVSLYSADFITHLLFTRNLQKICFKCVDMTLTLFGLADLVFMQVISWCKCPAFMRTVKGGLCPQTFGSSHALRSRGFYCLLVGVIQLKPQHHESESLFFSNYETFPDDSVTPTWLIPLLYSPLFLMTPGPPTPFIGFFSTTKMAPHLDG